MAANPDLRPMFNAPAKPAPIAVDPDGTMWLSDDISFRPDDEADADIGRPPSVGERPDPDPEPEQDPGEQPGFHVGVQARIASYSSQVPGNWTGTRGGTEIGELRSRAREVYWNLAPRNWNADEVWQREPLPNKAFKFLTPTLQDDIKLIASIVKDKTISPMEPFIVTAKRNNYLLKSDIRYFLKTAGVIEYRMMDALLAAVASVPDVQGPLPRYDYGGPYQSETVALPAITWDHIYQKFREREGEGDPPAKRARWMPDVIDPSINQPGDPTNVHGKLLGANALILPILLDGNHWMVAYIHLRRRTVLVLNTDFEAKDAVKQYRTVEKYLHYWNLQNLSIEPHMYPKYWTTIHANAASFNRATREQGSGLAAVISALLVVCDVAPNRIIPAELVDVRAFLAVVLSQGGFRGNVYFPHQDVARTRPWGDWFDTRGFWNKVLRRPLITVVAEPVDD